MISTYSLFEGAIGDFIQRGIEGNKSFYKNAIVPIKQRGIAAFKSGPKMPNGMQQYKMQPSHVSTIPKPAISNEMIKKYSGGR